MASSAEEQKAEAKASPSDTPKDDDTELTCDVLCALSSNSPPPGEEIACPTAKTKGKKGKQCGKQHQLPMFLSSKFIDYGGCQRDWIGTCKNNDAHSLLCYPSTCYV